MKRLLLFSSLSVFLMACANQTIEENESVDAETSVSSEQSSSSEASEATYQSIVENFTLVTAEEVTDKINNGDAFYLFVGEENSQDATLFASKLEEASAILENPSTAGIESEIYYLDLTEVDDQATEAFVDEYDIESVPIFQFFEGQIYYSAISDIDSESITVEDIQYFINYPYSDEDVTAAPDVEDENGEA